jgi:putative ABC transport system substrate-binding protein
VKAISGLDRDFDIVVSGIISAPEVEPRGITVHSLAPDPYLLFALFKSLVPGARRVFVVYDPTKNAWLIRIAKEAAKNLGLELVAQEASDLKAAMNLYQSVMASVDPKRDAIWLPQDSVTVDETLVLPKVLKEAWNRNLIVFSSNAAYVKQGVLFSLYPDNRLLGRKLATSVLNLRTSSERIVPLREVFAAVNSRTANLLGLNISQIHFDLMYPEQ